MPTARLVSRWIERLLATHDPPLSVAQYPALQGIAEGEVVGPELARARPSRRSPSHSCSPGPSRVGC